METLTHIAGTFLIAADGSFLNGAGLDVGEDRNTTVPKTMYRGRNRVPYVSAQAWRRWLRNTAVEEAGWPPSKLRAIGQSARATTAKIAGELDPVGFPEDDLFGYMCAEEGQGKAKADAGEPSANDAGRRVRALMRTSPLATSILAAVGTPRLSKDEGFVHLEEGTPLPYSTRFYSAHLAAVFCLDYSRVGRFVNIGDRVEINETRVAGWIQDGSLVDAGNGVYELKDRAAKRKKRTADLLNSIPVLRGGAKMAAFGTDVSPRVVICAGLSCGNPIFSHLFDSVDGVATVRVDTLNELARDFADKLSTRIFVGLRTGSVANEAEVRALDSNRFVVGTPVEAMRCLVRELP